MKKEFEQDEVILYEGLVKYGNLKKCVKFTLTNKKLIFAKEKGLFKKTFRIFDEILINSIKIYKDNVQIKQEKETIVIQCIDKTINFSCSNIVEARKVIEEIINIRTGSNVLERNKNRIKKVLNVVNDIKDIALMIGGIFVAIKRNKRPKGEK